MWVWTDQLADLRQRLDEDADDLTTATRARRQLESDLADTRAQMAKEVQGRERLLGELRQELLKVTHQSTVDLESERNAAALLRTNVKVSGARSGRAERITAPEPSPSLPACARAARRTVPDPALVVGGSFAGMF